MDVENHNRVSGRYITLNLALKDDENIEVLSYDVFTGGFHNTTMFNKNSTIDEVLVDELASAIKYCTRRLNDDLQMLVLPDFLIQMPGLVLSGARVIISQTRDGARTVIFRFKDFVGNVAGAFKKNVGLALSDTSQFELMAVDILSDICSPLIDLCTRPEVTQVGRQSGVGKQLSSIAAEIEFQLDLLRRFVFPEPPAAKKAQRRPQLAYQQQEAHHAG
ncbi:hypothetical protein [Amaricoccus tamworthensis]|uniref:hypothetical protein n=1 Tax=Amaricoccus tamworthensis TaxID=57002 RepID=UPI003C7C382C